MDGEIDATNKFRVGVRGQSVVILGWGRELARDDAMNLAAHIVAVVETIDEKRVIGSDPFNEYHAFDEWLNAVRRT